LPAIGANVTFPVPPAGPGEIVAVATGTGVIVTVTGGTVAPETGLGARVGTTVGIAVGTTVGIGVPVGIGVIAGIGVTDGRGVGTGVAVGRPPNHGNDGIGNGGDGTGGIVGRPLTTWASACALMTSFIRVPILTFNAGRRKSVALTKQIIAKKLMIALYMWHP
jgi:hypothetical protein